MKKLTSLQILMLMSLAVGSLHIQANHASKANNKKVAKPTAEQDLQEAAALELQAAKDLVLKNEVLADLVAISPTTIQEMIKEEDNLKEDLGSIKKFIHTKISEIEKLAQENVVDQKIVAKIALQLTEAQALLGEAIAEERSKHKHNYKYEQTIKDALIKAEQGLKLLSQKSVLLAEQTSEHASLEQTKQTDAKEVKKAKKKAWRLRARKNKSNQQ